MAPTVLRCPTCGAEQNDLPADGAESFSCKYCQATVLIPKAPVPNGATGGGSNRLLLGLSAFTAVGLVVVAVLVLSRTRPAPNETTILEPLPPSSASTAPSASSAPTAEPTTTIAVTFGSKGTEPGQFEDPRPIAIDQKGMVYVSDQSRLQVFDELGAFKKRLDLGADGDAARITSLATDYEGHLYVALKGALLQFELETGERKELVAATPQRNIRDITVDGRNIVYAAALNPASKETDIYQFDASGQQQAFWPKPLRSTYERGGMLLPRLLVVESGEVYALTRQQKGLVVLDKTGAFVNRVDIDELCGTSQTKAAALNKSGKLIVARGDGFALCSPSGKLEQTIDLPKGTGSIRGIAIAPGGRIYATTNKDTVIAVEP